MNQLIQKLEVALLRRNPQLAKSLQSGLAIEKIRKDLQRASIDGAIGPITELYSWKNGTTLQGNSEALNAGFTPPILCPLSEMEKQTYLQMGIKREAKSRAYHYVELKKAIVDMAGYKTYAQHQPRLAVLVGRYFPFLWDGSTEWVALDIESSSARRVVKIQIKQAVDEHPLRAAYGSFEEFLVDAIYANETNQPLSCMRMLGEPIIKVNQGRLESTTKLATPNAGKLPKTVNPLVVRTDFSNESAWKLLYKALREPNDELTPILDFISEPALDGLTAAEIPSRISESSPHAFAVIVDSTALTHSGNPVLVVDLHDKPGRTFRVVASALEHVASNLSIGNMDFEEFANAIDKDGIFRGFKSS